MSRPRKLYKVVGKAHKIQIPQPPLHATHVWLQVGKSKAMVRIEDFDTLWGVNGWFHYIRADRNQKILEKYNKKWRWIDNAVKGIEKLLK